MKGTKISIVFPTEVYTFLEQFTAQMHTVPLLNPQDGSQAKHSKTGLPVTLSMTGKVPELIHTAVIDAVISIIQRFPNDFRAQIPKMNGWVNQYGTYLQSLGESATGPQKA